VPAYVIWILVGALGLAALLIGADALLRRQVRSKTEEIRRLNEDLERRVTARTIELQAALKELESFSYSVSHDLRAPLRALDGFSRMLLDDYGDKLDDDAHHYLERIRQGAQQMATLINGLLELSRLNRSEIERRPIDLSALAGAVIDDLRETEPQRRVDVVIADGLVASADPGLSRTLLANLIGNAWKFTAKQATARIEVGVAEADGEPAYFVRDDGAGFDMAYAGKLFGAFQRLHGPDEFEGTGIGLATVQRIVRRHGGRVWAEAAVDKGATIFFTLPGPATNV
jgi:light-regulated signal transduction histidine kinase (bacteriophytochrome)